MPISVCASLLCVRMEGGPLCVGGENGKISSARLERKNLIQQFEPQIVPKYHGISYYIENFLSADSSVLLLVEGHPLVWVHPVSVMVDPL